MTDRELAEGFAFEGLPELARGQLVNGTVAGIVGTEVVVDVGYKYEGIVPLSEFETEPEVGATIPVTVARVDDENGRILLAHRDAARQIAWRELEDAHAERRPVTGRVKERVKGGFIVDCGVDCFMPFSLSGVRRSESPDELVGKEVTAYVESLDSRRRRATVDRKTYVDEQKEVAVAAFFPTIQRGDVLDGEVVGVTDFGAFVRVGPVDGLVRKGDLSWRQVEKPADAVRVGQRVKAVVLEVDEGNRRLLLGIKQAQRGRWHDEAKRVREGQVVMGTVAAVTPDGLRVALTGRLTGFLPAEELAKYERNLSNLGEGSQLSVRVREIDELNRRIVLAHPVK